MVKSLTSFLGTLYLYSVLLFIRLFRILKQLIASSFFLIKPQLKCGGRTYFFASLIAPESTLTPVHLLG